MKCQECGLEMRPVQLTAYASKLMAMTGMFKGCEVEGIACPKCGRLELRVKNPERLWNTEDK